MKVTYAKTASHIMNADKRKAWEIFIKGCTYEHINVALKPGADCYTCNQRMFGNTIVIGRDFYQIAHGLPDEVDTLDLKTHVYKDMSEKYTGVTLHELFHRLYTDMAYEQELLAKIPHKYKGFVHRIFNILEDVTIENSGIQEFPQYKHFIDRLSSIHFQEHCVEGMTAAIQEKPNSIHTFTAFLLFYARGFDITKLPCYNVFEDNRDMFEELLNKCKYDRIARSRHRSQYHFAIQVLKLLGGEDLNADDEKVLSKELDIDVDFPIGPGGRGGVKRIIEIIDKLAPISKHEGTMASTPEEAKEYDPTATTNMDNVEGKATIKAERESSQEYNPNLTASDLTKSGIEQIANDDPVSTYEHDVRRLDDYVDMSKYAPSYKEVVTKSSSLIQKFVSTIRKMRSQTGKRTYRGLPSGKFDMRAYIAGKPVNRMFMKDILPDALPDPVVYFFMDNSGSMSGNKAVLAGEACIPMCEALNSLNIPFGVYAFTECYSCITIELKSTKDLWEKVKYNLTLFTNNVHCEQCATYWGNIDEVNLRYVRDKLLAEPQKDKIMIIISDGATCGSERELAKVAEDMEKQGIKVLAVGIYDRNVEKIYKNYTICRTKEDLEKLPEFLQKYLVKSLGGK